MIQLTKKKLVFSIYVLLIIFSVLLIVNDVGLINNDDDDNVFVPSTITATNLYNVTYANVTYGHNTTTMWETDAMDDSDNTNASFIEDKYSSTAGYIFGDTTSDSVDNWAVNNRFDHLGVSTTEYYIGTKCIEFQAAANAGDGYFELNNNTSQAMSADVSTYDSQNFSIKSTSATMTLEYAVMVNTAGKYYLLEFNSLVIGTSWQVVGGSRAQATSYGGMTSTDPVNYIHWHFSNLDNNEWIYFDTLKIYSANTTKHLSVSYNFTSIANYDYYSLNVSAASNVTTEYMQMSDEFDDDAVYNIEGGGIWENFTILLNTTKIQADDYFLVFINSTALDDDYNSTLDIDLFQIYAWNETNSYPVINGAVLTNPDDTNKLYAGYRNYTFTLNISDADGFADIHYARIGLETEDGQYYWKAGFFEDNKSFVEELYPGNFTLQTSLSSNNCSGNYLNLTFSITIEVVHTSVTGFRLGCFVNDTNSASDEYEFALDYQTEVNVDITSPAISDDRGNRGATLYLTGTAIYFNSSNLVVNDGYYDAWGINLDGLTNVSDTSIVAGSINITIIASNSVGLDTWYIGAKAQGSIQTDTCHCATPEVVTYIADELIIVFTREILLPSSGDIVYFTPVIYYDYDDTDCLNYDMVVMKNDVVWKSFDETNYSSHFWDTASGEEHTYDVSSITENIYGITNFDSSPHAVDWYAGRGGGAGDEVSEDEFWDLFGFIEVDDDDEFMIFIAILMMLTIGCIVVGDIGCGSGIIKKRSGLITNTGRRLKDPIPLLFGKDDEKKKKKKYRPKKRKRKNRLKD